MQLAGFLLALMAARSAAAFPIPNQPAVTLLAGADVVAGVAAHEHKDFTLTVPADRAMALSLVQGEHFQTLTILQASGKTIQGPVRTNDSGSGAAISSTLVAAEEDAVYRVTVESYHKDEASEGRLVLRPLSDDSTNALRRAEAEGLFFDAEFLRRGKNAKEWPRAKEEFEAARNLAHASGERLLEQRILTEESRLLLFRLNDYTGAKEAAAGAVSVDVPDDSPKAGYTDLSAPTSRALALKTLGSTDYYLADYPSAIDHSTRALAIYQRLNDRYWEGILLGNLAYVYLESGDSSSARDTGEQALKLADTLHDEYGRIFTLEALGSIHAARGEPDQSYASYQQALQALQKTPYPAVEANVWRGLGSFYKDVGKPDAAEDAYSHAIKAAKDASDTAALLESTSEMADLERTQGKLKAAHAAYLSALPVSVASSLPREEVLLKAGLARTLGAEHQAAAAMQEARDAMARATAIGFTEGEAEASLVIADLEFTLGHRSAAREAYRQAEVTLTRAQERGQAAYAIARIARIDVGFGNVDSALRESEEALSLIERTRSLVPGRELRTSYFAERQSVYALSIQLMLRLDRAQPGKGFGERAFEIAERSRGRSLLDAAQTGPTGEVAGLGPQTVACEQKLSAAYRRLPDLYLTTENANYRIAQTRQQIQSLLAQCDALASLDRHTQIQAATEFATPALVESSMRRQHASLLEFWLGETESVAWHMSQGSFRMTHLPPRRTIERLVEATNSAIVARQERVPGEDLAARARRLRASDEHAKVLLTQLGAMLLRPAGRREKSLYIVPDGKLADLPFAALTDPATGDPLIEQTKVAEEPSSSLLLQLLARRTANAQTSSHKVAIFADPVYSDTDERVQTKLTSVSQVSTPGLFALDRLPASGVEAEFLARLAGTPHSDVHLGQDASARTMLSTDWGSYRVMHLALHTLGGSSPAFTGIAFNMVDLHGHHEDGMLWLNQIYRLHGVPEMVFLSGCQTAEGQSIPGEGIASLAHAFLSVGAGSVVGSLWSVEDDASSELVRNFYTNLLERRLSPGDALRRAQLALADKPNFRAPYFWAAFQLEGLPESAAHASR